MPRYRGRVLDSTLGQDQPRRLFRSLAYNSSSSSDSEPEAVPEVSSLNSGVALFNWTLGLGSGSGESDDDNNNNENNNDDQYSVNNSDSERSNHSRSGNSSNDDSHSDQESTHSSNDRIPSPDSDSGQVFRRRRRNTGGVVELSSSPSSASSSEADTDSSIHSEGSAPNSPQRLQYFSASELSEDEADQPSGTLSNRSSSDSELSQISSTPFFGRRSRLTDNSVNRIHLELDSSNGPEDIFGEFMQGLSRPNESIPLPEPENFQLPSSFAMAFRSETTSRPTTSGTSATAATTNSATSFECSVCLENLDLPASIDLSHLQNSEPAAAEANAYIAVPLPGPSSRVRVSGGRRRTSQRIDLNQNMTPTDVVATFCGHMYHQVCLEKWFQEEGKRTCPSCRKTVARSKVIRLYPNISTDSGGTNQVVATGAGVVAGPSTGNGSNPGTSGLPSLGGIDCERPECQDVKMLHTTLLNDYTDLRNRYQQLRDDEGVKDAQIQSLVEDNERKGNEIAKLKREIDELEKGSQSSQSSSGAKRRRR